MGPAPAPGPRARAATGRAAGPARLAAVVLGYAVLCVAWTWPVAAHLRTRFAGQGSDLFTAQWDIWWVGRVLAEGRWPLFTPYLFHPLGVDLSFHSTSWLSCLLALPFVALGGPALGWNASFLLMTLFCALGMFAFARSLTGRQDAAFLAGIVFAFAPYRLSQAAEHPNFGGLAFVPLALWGVLACLRGGGGRAALAAAGGLALTLLTGAHLFFMACVLVGLLVLWLAVRDGRRDPRGFGRALLLLAGAVLLLCGPLALQYAGGFQAALEGYTDELPSTDLLAFWIPSRAHPWLGPPLAELYARLGPNRHFYASLGVVPLALLVAGLLHPDTRRSASFWGLGCGCFGLLCLGPELHVGGRVVATWMPYRLIAGLAPLEMLRSPDRFNTMLITCLAPAAAWGLVAVTRWLPEGREGLRRAVVCALTAAVLFEYLPAPYPTTPIPVSSFYRELATRDDGLAILELPLQRQASKRAMARVPVHGRPLVGGMVARTPAAADDYITASPLLHALYQPVLLPLDCRRVPLRGELARLRRDGVGWVVLRHGVAGPKRLEIYRSYFTGPPAYEDRLLTVFELDQLLAGRLPCDP